MYPIPCLVVILNEGMVWVWLVCWIIPDRNVRLLEGQRFFRQTVMPSGRRMAFKAMNDKFRRQALVPFLRLEDHIEGWLVLFAVSKVRGSAFGGPEESAQDLLGVVRGGLNNRGQVGLGFE